jgi:fumarylpyruvate hydrolase
MTGSADTEFPTLEIAGREDRFRIHRVYCVGWNYAAHVREMGSTPDREPPIFFQKPVDALVPNGGRVAYPPMTQNLHHEIELVAAIGKSATAIDAACADEHVWGYAVGIDLTRRDLQANARQKGQPWDTAKAFDQSAPIGVLYPAADIGHPRRGRIWLSVNGEVRQDGDLSQQIWSVAEIVAHLSAYFWLRPGDLIYTGTPAGVGPIVSGDIVEGGIDGLGGIRVEIVPPATR